jgi:hypothetical protein
MTPSERGTLTVGVMMSAGDEPSSNWSTNGSGRSIYESRTKDTRSHASGPIRILKVDDA